MIRVIRARLRRLSTDDSGQVTAFATCISLALLTVAGLVLDGGMAISAKVQAFDAAQAAARAGAQQIDLSLYRTQGRTQLDPNRAAAAARSWITSAGMTGTASATTTTVTVTVTRTSNTQLLQIIGVQHLTISATAKATAIQGVTGPGT